MAGGGVLRQSVAMTQAARSRQLENLQCATLGAGIASSVLYAAMNVIIPLYWPSYSSLSQTVSELSAVAAPTRTLWVGHGFVYTTLILVFGLGLWTSRPPVRHIRIMGALIVAYGTLGIYWPPMHQREIIAAGGGTLTDTLHLVWAGVTIALMLTVITIGAAAYRGAFRLYSILTIAAMAAFGMLTGIQSIRIEQGLPTPWIGLWERASIVSYLLWIAVFAFIQLRTIRSRNS